MTVVNQLEKPKRRLDTPAERAVADGPDQLPRRFAGNEADLLEAFETDQLMREEIDNRPRVVSASASSERFLPGVAVADPNSRGQTFDAPRLAELHNGLFAPIERGGTITPQKFEQADEQKCEEEHRKADHEKVADSSEKRNLPEVQPLKKIADRAEQALEPVAPALQPARIPIRPRKERNDLLSAGVVPREFFLAQHRLQMLAPVQQVRTSS